MATYTFPADSFTVEGDPEGVRETGRAYGRFASVAGEAAATTGGLDSGGWVGSEGDLFRARAAEIPPHLDTARTAFGQVSRALDEFAEVLAAAQRQMTGARDQATQTFGSLAGAPAGRARLDDAAGGEAADLDARIDRLESAFDDQVAVATGIRAQVLEAARRSAAAIRGAGRTSPTAGQNFIEDGLEKTGRWASRRLDDLKGFLAEHAEFLHGLAQVLRVVGVVLVAVGAVLAIFGVGAAVLPVGLALWGAADVLDTTVDWAEGKISGQELLWRAGTAIVLTVAGGVVAKLGAKLLERLGPRIRRLLGTGGGRLDDWTPGKALPEAPSAAIDDAKFLKYSMDPGNPNNGGKWKAWSQLGYDVDDLTNRTAASDDVIRQVRDQLETLPAQAGKETGFGRRFEVNIPITGPNGRTGTLFTVWQFDEGSTTPRMITNLLKVHQ
jgi:hypothetical protein